MAVMNSIDWKREMMATTHLVSFVSNLCVGTTKFRTLLASQSNLGEFY